MKRALLVVAGMLLVAYDVYLLVGGSYANVKGNLEAAVIWATPAFVASHLLHRRHIDRRHDEVTQRLDAQDRALNLADRDRG